MYFHILPERDLGRGVQLRGRPHVGAAVRSRCCSVVVSGYIRHLLAIGPETRR